MKPSKINRKSIWDIDSSRKFYADFESDVRFASNLQNRLVFNDFLCVFYSDTTFLFYRPRFSCRVAAARKSWLVSL